MKIVMVLTSHDRPGETDRKTDFSREEFAAPYFAFRDAGVQPKWQPFSIVDGGLVGQNPASSTSAAEALLGVLASRAAA
jgi:hypothetical protein